MNFNAGALRAVVKWVRNRDEDTTVLDKIPSQNIDLIWKSGQDGLHFVKIAIAYNQLPEPFSDYYREKMEQEIGNWLSLNNDAIIDDLHIHFDAAYLRVVGDDKAFLKYHHDCFD